ncbi:hypothetical protein K8089_03160 [Aequorivita sp. F47161]|uniref:Flagellar motor protein MotB n=1 Tax=Aequorivita vitellina TaxID=2874475 RepID=A0A9X1U289_9FLAO|nr:hypothetical protein [Aequorivita vitellina]MCG2418007.1 hypothetical protein [Aequorivita vitellina]
MIIKKNLLALLFFASISTFSFSQSNLYKTDGNKHIDVVLVYEQVVRDGYGTPFIYERLATAYYFKGEYDKAVSWFQKFYSEQTSTDPQLAYQYSQSLKAVAFKTSEKSAKAVVLK